MTKRTRVNGATRNRRTLRLDAASQQFVDEIGITQQVMTYAKKRRSIILEGDPGIGKTLLIRQTISYLGSPLFQKQGGKFPVSKLVGSYQLQARDGATTTVFEEGPLVRAIKEGGTFYLDEIDNLSADIYDLLHPILDDRREISLADIGITSAGKSEFVHAHPEFWFVASCINKSTLPEDFLDRFRVIRLKRLSVDAQIQKVSELFHLPFATIERLVRIGELTRKIGWAKPASFRQVIGSAQDVVDGLAIEAAVDNNLINPNSNQDADRIALRQAMDREGLGSTRVLADTLVPEEQNQVPVFDIDSLE